MAEQIYYCEGCGGVLQWDPVSQKLKCPNCGNSRELKNEQDKIVEHTLTLDAKRKVTAKEKTSQTMECKGCGARIEIGANETAAQCPYCGSNYVLADKQEDVLTPDGVIPFRIDKNGVKDCFRNWIRKRWFAPNELKRLYQGSAFQGIYVPYWTFDAQCDCHFDAEGGTVHTETYEDKDGNTHTRTYTTWHPTHGHIRHFFDDIQTAASKRFRQGLLSGLEPYNFMQLASYTPEYISGYLSENYSIGLEDGHQNAREKMRQQLYSMAQSEVLAYYDECRNIRLYDRYDDETYKYVLVPVYSTTYGYKGKNYAVVINGQSGVVKGEYPKSPVKIAILVIVIIAIVFFFVFGIPALTDGDTGYGRNVDFEQDVVAIEPDSHAFVMLEEQNASDPVLKLDDFLFYDEFGLEG